MVLFQHSSIRAAVFAMVSDAGIVLVCLYMPVFAVYSILMITILRKSRNVSELRDKNGVPLTYLSIGNPSTIRMLFTRDIRDVQTKKLLRATRLIFITLMVLTGGLVAVSLVQNAM